MDILGAIIIVLGLAVFETVASIDNAIINADILSTMKEKARRWFLTWGLFIAVFVIRGILPWIIIWASTPALGPVGALTATFSGDGTAAAAIQSTAPYLMVGGGIFLLLLFLHWLLVEEKNCIVPGERFLTHLEPWFNAAAAALALVLILIASTVDFYLTIPIAIGSLVFFIMMGIRMFADKKSVEMEKNTGASSNHSDISKLVLLEVIDASFSVDGVIGAFAFTMSVPLILIGNGLGAFVVRELTVRNIDNIRKFAYLKNGAMYSIGCLGLIMCLEAFGLELPIWFAPVVTIVVVAIFFLLSLYKIKKSDYGVCKLRKNT